MFEKCASFQTKAAYQWEASEVLLSLSDKVACNYSKWSIFYKGFGGRRVFRSGNTSYIPHEKAKLRRRSIEPMLAATCSSYVPDSHKNMPILGSLISSTVKQQKGKRFPPMDEHSLRTICHCLLDSDGSNSKKMCPHAWAPPRTTSPSILNHLAPSSSNWGLKSWSFSQYTVLPPYPPRPSWANR